MKPMTKRTALYIQMLTLSDAVIPHSVLRMVHDNSTGLLPYLHTTTAQVFCHTCTQQQHKSSAIPAHGNSKYPATPAHNNSTSFLSYLHMKAAQTFCHICTRQEHRLSTTSAHANSIDFLPHLHTTAQTFCHICAQHHRLSATSAHANITDFLPHLHTPTAQTFYHICTRQ